MIRVQRPQAIRPWSLKNGLRLGLRAYSIDNKSGATVPGASGAAASTSGSRSAAASHATGAVPGNGAVNDATASTASATADSVATAVAGSKRTPLDPAPLAPGPPTIPQKLVASLPQSVRPYAQLMRLDRPVGTWLLYTPGTSAITMAAYATGAPMSQTLTTLALFGVGSLVMRGAGCTINDILDRKLDAQVERTRGRPMASGAVSVPQAVTFLGAQCFTALGVLLCLPPESFWITAASLPLVATYPLFKRFTYYPQVSLSLCFTWAALVGFPAMHVWNWPAMLSLYGASFSWCMIYDTIYAHQDKKFDIVAGIKSTALKWGDRSKSIMKRYAIAQVALTTAAGLFVPMGPFYFAGVGAVAYRVFDMIRRVDLDDPVDCWRWFLSNIKTGHFLFAGSFLDYVCRLAGFF